MTAAAIVSAIRAAGVRLAVEGDRIRLSPPGVVPADLRTKLRDAKPQVMALLAHEAADADAAIQVEDACVECGSTSWSVSLVDEELNRTCIACLTGRTQLRRAGVPA